MSDLQRHRKGQGMKPEDTGKSRSELETAIDEWVFSERDREVLKRRWFDGITYDSLGDMFQMSPRQIKNIVYRCGDRVLRHL